MATAGGLDKKIPRGKARLELESDGKSVTVHLDRPGFRRLLETLERLAETGDAQAFQKSGRSPTKADNESGEQNLDLQKLMFHIDS